MLPTEMSCVNAENTSDWTILVLELDNASRVVGESLKDIYKDMVVSVHRDINYFNKEDIKKFLSKIPIPNTKVLGVWGNGCFHQYTYGLCTAIADRRSKSYGYVHIDHHSDTADYDMPINFSCGGFVASILRDSNAQTVRFIGNAGFPFKNLEGKFSGTRYLSESGLRGKKSNSINVGRLEHLLEGTPEDLYISMDLDVIDMNEISTSFRGGSVGGTITSEELLKILRLMDERKNIIGADVLGYSGRGWGIDLYGAIADTLIKKRSYNRDS